MITGTQALSAEIEFGSRTFWALLPVFLLVFTVVGYALADLLRAEHVRYLPKPVWALVIVLGSTPLGALAYLLLGGSHHEAHRDDQSHSVMTTTTRSTTRRTGAAQTVRHGELTVRAAWRLFSATFLLNWGLGVLVIAFMDQVESWFGPMGHTNPAFIMMVCHGHAMLRRDTGSTAVLLGGDPRQAEPAPSPRPAPPAQRLDHSATTPTTAGRR